MPTPGDTSTYRPDDDSATEMATSLSGRLQQVKTQIVKLEKQLGSEADSNRS